MNMSQVLLSWNLHHSISDIKNIFFAQIKFKLFLYKMTKLILP